MTEQIFIGRGAVDQHLSLKLANRHGLIAGATGTGKTVSLQILAEGFSEAGVPVFMADIKGDLSGMSQSGVEKDFLEERARTIGLEDYHYTRYPVVFWDVFGEQGHPVRTTISEMGPILLSRQLGLNDTQEGVLTIAFRLADEDGLLLLDLKDLREMLVFMSENAKEISARYGNVTAASIGAIQRRLLTLETQGGDKFFGEPALKLQDLMRLTYDGRGQVNILAADILVRAPQLYATFMLWLMSELFEELPEVGDPDKPKLVFFFDEAHLLFDDAPKHLVDRIAQVVKLIRSKGVGIYFVTQNPLDVPDEVLGQLGNRVQHALRAFTPRDQKAVRVAAETFRENPELNTRKVITELGVGEALTSTLGKKGVPGIVQRTLIRPPKSRLGPATPEERKAVMQASPVGTSYDMAVDRESAFEVLKVRRKQIEAERDAAEKAAQAEKERKAREKAEARMRPRTSRRQGATEAFIKSMVRQVGHTLGRELIRGILGSLKK